MTGQLELRVKLLDLKIPYKYVVFTEKSRTKEDGWYEFIRLPERKRGDPNRALNLSQRAIQQATDEGMLSLVRCKYHDHACMYDTAGVYHQYDSMVFPSDVLITKGRGERFMSSVKSLLPWGKKNEDNLEVPEYHTILQNCFMFYIDANYKEVISTGQFSDSLPIAMVVQRIYHIFTCLLESQFTYQDGRRTIWLINAGIKQQPLQEVFLCY